MSYGAFLTSRSDLDRDHLPTPYFQTFRVACFIAPILVVPTRINRPFAGPGLAADPFALTLAAMELQRNRDFTAGCLLGCCLFKFHLILTLVVFLASLGRKKLLPGFALVFVVLLLISVGTSGWGFVTEYPRFLIKLSSLPIAGIHPAGMANIRGLISVSGIAKNAAARLALIWLVSIFLFWYAWRSFKGVTSNLDHARDWRSGTFFSWQFSSAII
jgi:hypothetical protein